MKDYFFDNPFLLFPEKGYDYTVDSDRDVAYISRLFPDLIKQIQYETNMILDHYDYRISPIYDMYPDREILLSMITQIHKNVMNRGLEIPVSASTAGYPVGTAGDSTQTRHCLYHITMLVFTHELLNRRRHHRAVAF